MQEEKRIFESTLEKDTYSIFKGIQTRKEALELAEIYSRTIRHYRKVMGNGVESSLLIMIKCRYLGVKL